MPWTCPSCGGETDLGYNVCWTCQVPRPGADPDYTNEAEIPAGTDSGLPNSPSVVDNMLITTTPTLATHTINAYLGPVFGETIFGANALRDFLAGFTDLVGGRSSAYETVLVRGRKAAISEMAKRAAEQGANAVVAMRFDYSTVGDTMLMICCCGTAVIVAPNKAAVDSTGDCE